MGLRNLFVTFLLTTSAVCGSLSSDAPLTSSDPVLINEGRSNGVIKKVDGFDMYISYPPGHHLHGRKPKAGILHLTDMLGLPLAENLLGEPNLFLLPPKQETSKLTARDPHKHGRLADSFARAGHVVVAPDLFAGKPAPDDHDRLGLDFSVVKFLDAHPPNVTEPVADAAVRHLRGALGVTRLGSAGYCFGGRYSFRYASAAKHAAGLGVDVVGTVGRAGPATVAAAQNDPFLIPPQRRWEIETALLSTDVPSSLALYSGVAHGFGLRVNLSHPEARFAKEAAFAQAVRWFDYWLCPGQGADFTMNG